MSGRTLKSALTASKRWLSAGSCCRMSAEPRKIDTSACHFFCMSDQVPSTRSTVPSLRCQVDTLSRKTGLACGPLQSSCSTWEFQRVQLLGAWDMGLCHCPQLGCCWHGRYSLQACKEGDASGHHDPNSSMVKMLRKMWHIHALEDKASCGIWVWGLGFRLTWTYLEPLMFWSCRLSLSSASVTASSGTSCMASESCTTRPLAPVHCSQHCKRRP